MRPWSWAFAGKTMLFPLDQNLESVLRFSQNNGKRLQTAIHHKLMIWGRNLCTSTLHTWQREAQESHRVCFGELTVQNRKAIFLAIQESPMLPSTSTPVPAWVKPCVQRNALLSKWLLHTAHLVLERAANRASILFMGEFSHHPHILVPSPSLV